jgi:hypothetical protein
MTCEWKVVIKKHYYFYSDFDSVAGNVIIVILKIFFIYKYIKMKVVNFVSFYL